MEYLKKLLYKKNIALKCKITEGGFGKIYFGTVNGKEVIVGINIRPHWKEALNIIKDKYHIIAYTHFQFIMRNMIIIKFI